MNYISKVCKYCGATAAAAKLQQQQHASLTFLSKKNTKKNQKKQSSHLPRSSSTIAQNVWPKNELANCGPEMNWRGIFSLAQEHEQDFKLYLV